jgi:hypothetical protein
MSVIKIGTKINVMCTECGRKWGVYLEADDKLPSGWNICLKCESIKNVKKDVNNDNIRDINKLY